METQPVTWTSILISWAPFLLLIAFWIFFMVVMLRGRQRKYFERSMVYMERQEALLERIAAALERIEKKQP